VSIDDDSGEDENMKDLEHPDFYKPPPIPE